MCIHICYRRDYCEKREVCVSNSKSMAPRLFHDVYVYWVCNSGSKTKECACIFSCSDGNYSLAVLPLRILSCSGLVTYILCSEARTWLGPPNFCGMADPMNYTEEVGFPSIISWLPMELAFLKARFDTLKCFHMGFFQRGFCNLGSGGGVGKGGGWRGVGEGLGRRGSRGIGEGLGRAWLSIVQKPRLKKKKSSLETHACPLLKRAFPPI